MNTFTDSRFKSKHATQVYRNLNQNLLHTPSKLQFKV
jgi:hypothetical protein